MQTITTKYLGPTNTKGSRIKASCEGGSITVSLDYGVEIEQDYMKAAKALKDKMNWSGEMIGGHTKDGMVFVFVNDFYKID